MTLVCPATHTPLWTYKKLFSNRIYVGVFFIKAKPKYIFGSDVQGHGVWVHVRLYPNEILIFWSSYCWGLFVHILLS